MTPAIICSFVSSMLNWQLRFMTEFKTGLGEFSECQSKLSDSAVFSLLDEKKKNRKTSRSISLYSL